MRPQPLSPRLFAALCAHWNDRNDSPCYAIGYPRGICVPKEPGRGDTASHRTTARAGFAYWCSERSAHSRHRLPLTNVIWGGGPCRCAPATCHTAPSRSPCPNVYRAKTGRFGLPLDIDSGTGWRGPRHGEKAGKRMP